MRSAHGTFLCTIETPATSFICPPSLDTGVGTCTETHPTLYISTLCRVIGPSLLFSVTHLCRVEPHCDHKECGYPSVLRGSEKHMIFIVVSKCVCSRTAVKSINALIGSVRAQWAIKYICLTRENKYMKIVAVISTFISQQEGSWFKSWSSRGVHVFSPGTPASSQKTNWGFLKKKAKIKYQFSKTEPET